MSDVPSDLFREILLRLPAESLFRFRAVCKAWCRTIDDPFFIKSHTIDPLQSESCSLLIRDSIFWRLFSLSLDADHIHRQHTVDMTRIKNLVRCCVPSLRDLPTTSCHGLILISHFNFRKIWAIWNPLTRECRELSSPDDIEYPLAGVGLGYDYATDDYKVVRIDDWNLDGKFALETRVYSLKSGTWRAIKECPCDLILQSSGVYHNGALHWISENAIIQLDLGTEEYRLLPLPLPLPLPPPSFIENIFEMYMDALDGCLFLSRYRFDEFERGERLHIWMMKDERSVETTWIDFFSFEEQRSDVSVMRDILRPVAYLKSKGQVFLQRNNHFYCFDLRKKDSTKKLTVHGLPECFTCQNFHGSLVRLHGGGGVGGSNAAKRRVNRRKKKKKVVVQVSSVRVDYLCHSDSNCSYEGQN